jgi:hypothetical protein
MVPVRVDNINIKNNASVPQPLYYMFEQAHNIIIVFVPSVLCVYKCIEYNRLLYITKIIYKNIKWEEFLGEMSI